MQTEAQRLERIAATLQAQAATHQSFADKYGSKEEEAQAASYRRAAAIIRHQIECEA